MRLFVQAMIASLCLFGISKGALAQGKIGVLFSSFGDIDDVKTELRPYIRNTLTDPDVLPLPAWLRATIADVGWYIQKRQLVRHYEEIGGATRTRQRSQDEADQVALELRSRGYDAIGYAGFTMTFPDVASQMEKARLDGVEELLVFYQGAQYSRDTAGVVFRHVRAYLASHPEWRVRVLGFRSFSDDERFVDLIAGRIEARLATDLRSYDAQDVCIFLPIHGNVLRLAREGDPYLDQVMRVVQALKRRFPASDVSHGYQNHDEIPGVPWSQPKAEKAILDVAQATCSAVLINGQISFTVDNLETLYDQKLELPRLLAAEVQRLGHRAKEVVVDDSFGSDPNFVRYMADLTEEARQGRGDLEVLREF